MYHAKHIQSWYTMASTAGAVFDFAVLDGSHVETTYELSSGLSLQH